MRVELLPRARVVTPNIPEAEVLSGRADRLARRCARGGAADSRHGAGAVIIKGGHAGGRQGSGRDARSWICCSTTARFTSSATPRIDTPNTHGTGCTFASAIAAYLALGQPLPDAAARAQAYVAGAIGTRLPSATATVRSNHFWEWRRS